VRSACGFTSIGDRRETASAVVDAASRLRSRARIEARERERLEAPLVALAAVEPARRRGVSDLAA